MKLRVVVTVLLLITLIVTALILAPGRHVLALPPDGTAIQQVAPPTVN